MIFVVGALTTNILPVNEATLATFTCSASSNHKNINEVTKHFNHKCFAPENYWLYGILIMLVHTDYILVYSSHFLWSAVPLWLSW